MMNETVLSTNDSYNLTAEEIEQWQKLLDLHRYTVHWILGPIVMIIGTIGNIATITVMSRRHMQSSTTHYLTALAVSDMLYLMIFFTLSFKHMPGSHLDNVHYWHYSRYALWLIDASSSTSIWLTVTFTIERYIAVCHPIKGKVLCTESRAKKVIIAVYVLVFLLTITTPHEWIVVEDTSKNDTRLKLTSSKLGDNPVYVTVFNWFSTVVFILVPLILLAVFNTVLILAVKKSHKQRTFMTGNCLPRDNNSKQEQKITIMLISVVLLAIVCQAPTAGMLIYLTFREPQVGTAELYICTIMNNYFNLLTGINAAVNFIFYCALSDRYRRTFIKTFCSRWTKRQSPPPSWVATTGYTNFEDGSPRTSIRGSSVRHSRTSSYKSSISSGSRTSPSQTAVKVLERHHGSPYLTVPLRGISSNTLEEEDEELTAVPKFSCSSTGHPSTPRTYFLRQKFRNGGTKSTHEDNALATDSDEPQDPSSDLFDESLKISLESAVAPPEKKVRKASRKLSLTNYFSNLKSKPDPKPSSNLRGRNIVITCQHPSMDEQTAV